MLQLAVALACLVPLAAGAAGVLDGPRLVVDGPPPASPDLDSHFRYLSGLLFGVGVAFASCIPGIEKKARLFLALGAIVVAGGLARLFGFVLHGAPSLPHQLALLMELAVTPALVTWQRRVARRVS